MASIMEMSLIWAAAVRNGTDRLYLVRNRVNYDNKGQVFRNVHEYLMLTTRTFGFKNFELVIHCQLGHTISDRSFRKKGRFVYDENAGRRE